MSELMESCLTCQLHNRSSLSNLDYEVMFIYEIRDLAFVDIFIFGYQESLGISIGNETIKIKLSKAVKTRTAVS